MCGIVIGTMALSGVQVLSDGLNELAWAELVRLGASEVRVIPLKRQTIDFVEFPRDTIIHFEPEDAKSLGTFVAQAGGDVWLLDSGAVRARLDSRDRGISVIGIYSDAPVSHDSVLTGRTPDFGRGGEADSNSVFVSFRLARLLIDSAESVGNALDRTFILRNRLLRIVGVGDSTAKGKFPIVWLRRETAHAIDLGAEQAMVVRRSAGSSPESLFELSAVIGRWIDANRPAWRGATFVSARGASNVEAMRRRARLVRLSLTAFCLLTVLVAATGIANVIFASVLERVREVGVRKAVGARFSDVFAQFLVESVALTALGATLGIALGWLIASAFAWYVRWDTGQPLHAELQLSTVIISTAIALAAGLAAGVGPSLRAARWPPSEAMRTE